jgi:hypothetical protein
MHREIAERCVPPPPQTKMAREREMPLLDSRGKTMTKLLKTRPGCCGTGAAFVRPDGKNRRPLADWQKENGGYAPWHIRRLAQDNRSKLISASA